jgi:hypothetical protein
MGRPAEFFEFTGHSWHTVHAAWVRYCKANGLWDRDNDVPNS